MYQLRFFLYLLAMISFFVSGFATEPAKAQSAVVLPYEIQDLPSKGRLYRGKTEHSKTGTAQQFAYDLDAAVPDKDGKWWNYKPTINWDDPKNSD